MHGERCARDARHTVQSPKPRTFAHGAQEWQCVEVVDYRSSNALETERVGASDAFAGNKIDSGSHVESVMTSMALADTMINHVQCNPGRFVGVHPCVCQAIGAVVYRINPNYRPA